MANLENTHSEDQATPRFERFCETAGKAVREIAKYIKYAAIVAVGFGVADAQAAPTRKPKSASRAETELILTLSPFDLGMPIKLDENGRIPLPNTCDTGKCGLEVKCKLPDGNYAPPASQRINITDKHRGKELVLPSCDKGGGMLTVGIPPQQKNEPDIAPLPDPPLPPAEELSVPAPAPVSDTPATIAPTNMPPAQLSDSRQRDFRNHHFSFIENFRLHLAGDHLLESGVASGIRWPIALVGKNTRLGVALEGSYLFGNQAISQTHPLFEPRDPTKMLNADSWAALGGPYIERTFGNTHGLHFNVNAALTAGAFSLYVNGDTDLAVSRTDPLQLGGIPEYRTTVPAASLCLGAHIGYGRLFLGGELCADATISPLQISAGDSQMHRLTGISAAAGVGFTFPHPGDWNKSIE